MEPLFEGLTKSEIEYLSYLRERGYFDGMEMFMNMDTSADYRVKKFEKNDYIELSTPGPHPGSYSVTITGKGIAAIVDYDKYQNQIQPLNEEINALNQIVDVLRQQAETAEKSSKSSTKYARISTSLSIIAIIVSIVALIK